MSIFAKRKPEQTEQEQREARERLADEIATARAVLARYPRGTKPHFGAQWKNTGKVNASIEEAYTGHELVAAFGRRLRAASKVSP